MNGNAIQGTLSQLSDNHHQSNALPPSAFGSSDAQTGPVVQFRDDLNKAMDSTQGTPLTERKIGWLKWIVDGIKSIFSAIYEKIWGKKTLSPERKALGEALDGGNKGTEGAARDAQIAVGREDDDVFEECVLASPRQVSRPGHVPKALEELQQELSAFLSSRHLVDEDIFHDFIGESASNEMDEVSSETTPAALSSGFIEESAHITQAPDEALSAAAEVVFTRVAEPESYIEFNAVNGKTGYDNAVAIFAVFKEEAVKKLEPLGLTHLLAEGVSMSLERDDNNENHKIIVDVKEEAAKQLVAIGPAYVAPFACKGQVTLRVSDTRIAVDATATGRVASWALNRGAICNILANKLEDPVKRALAL